MTPVCFTGAKQDDAMSCINALMVMISENPGFFVSFIKGS